MQLLMSAGCLRDRNAAVYSDICFPDPSCDSRRLLRWYQALPVSWVGAAHHIQGMYCMLCFFPAILAKGPVGEYLIGQVLLPSTVHIIDFH